MYTEKVIKRFQNPEHAGEMKDANAVGTVGNQACGDIMQLYLKVNDETKVIEKAGFKTFGCAAAIASTDVACEMITGMTLDEALKVTNKQVIAQLGELPPHKIHCSVLAEESIDAAVKDYYKRQEKLNKKN